jgi:hypothetical protein
MCAQRRLQAAQLTLTADKANRPLQTHSPPGTSRPDNSGPLITVKLARHLVPCGLPAPWSPTCGPSRPARRRWRRQ